MISSLKHLDEYAEELRMISEDKKVGLKVMQSLCDNQEIPSSIGCVNLK